MMIRRQRQFISTLWALLLCVCSGRYGVEGKEMEERSIKRDFSARWLGVIAAWIRELDVHIASRHIESASGFIPFTFSSPTSVFSTVLHLRWAICDGGETRQSRYLPQWLDHLTVKSRCASASLPPPTALAYAASLIQKQSYRKSHCLQPLCHYYRFTQIWVRPV